ncbi:MAG: hypothetical protein AAFV88_01735 [Planctomycetota bacterium]
MRFAQIVLACVVSASLVSQAPAEDVKPELRESLEKLIPEGIRLLTKKEFVPFVKAYVPPEELKKILKRMSLEEFAEKFGKSKAGRLLDVLKEIKDATPEMNDEKTKAVYKLKSSIGGKQSITFQKIEKYWYIEN